MSSDLSGFPASALARLNAMANTQSVAVRLINLPDDLSNGKTPLRLEGVVTGQRQDGAVVVQTDRGTIAIQLKDHQALPQGLKLILDIPAGRSPQQASIRAAQEQPPAPPSIAQPQTSSPVPLASHLIQSSLPSATAAATLRLDRSAPINPTQISDALAITASAEEGIPAIKTPPAPLLPGQTVRLLPLPPGSMPALTLQPGAISPLPQSMLLETIATLVQQLPPDQAVTKDRVAALLGNMDLSQLRSPGQPKNSATQLSSLPQSLQSILQPNTGAATTASLPGVPLATFNPARPLDIQIAAIFPPVTSSPAQPASLSIPSPIQITQSIPASSASSLPASPLPHSIAPPTQSKSVSAASLPLSPPTHHRTSTSMALTPQVISAQVTGITTQNLPIVSVTTPAAGFTQSYIVQFASNNLLPGTPLLATLSPAQPATPTQPSPLGSLPLSSWLQPEIWDNLDSIIQTLHTINPGIAHSLINMLPSPSQPQNMGGLALFFLSMLRSGDMEGWMSSPVANLLRQSGKGDILRALATESGINTRTESPLLPQEWRATVLPLYHDQHVYKLPLYYKRIQEDDSGKDERNRREKMLRFLFDLKMSRMGSVQIDGFFQSQRLDMILRTKSALSPHMQRTMKGLYVSAMEKSNLGGELTFQFKPEHWVSIDMPATQSNVGVSA